MRRSAHSTFPCHSFVPFCLSTTVWDMATSHSLSLPDLHSQIGSGCPFHLPILTASKCSTALAVPLQPSSLYDQPVTTTPHSILVLPTPLSSCLIDYSIPSSGLSLLTSHPSIYPVLPMSLPTFMPLPHSLNNVSYRRMKEDAFLLSYSGGTLVNSYGRGTRWLFCLLLPGLLPATGHGSHLPLPTTSYWTSQYMCLCIFY